MQKTSLFDNIKSEIPSIDADVLYSSDDEDEISVYQRPLLSKLHPLELTDLDISLEEPEIEDLLKSVTQPFIDGTNDDLNSQKDCLTSQLPAKHKQHSAEALTGAELKESTPNLTRRENLTSKAVHNSKLLNDKLTFVHQESRKHHTDSQAAAGQNSLTECSKLENDSKLQTAVKVYESQSLENMEHLYNRPYPVLSLQTLENLDLDQVLQSLKQHGYPKETTKKEGHVLPFKKTGNCRKRENNIMEQLAAFCMKQPCNETEDEKSLQSPCEKNYSTTRQTHPWSNDFKADEKALHLKNEFYPTIHIDLRNTDHRKKPTVIHNTSSSAAHAHLTKQVLFTERVEIAQTEAATNTRTLTGKSLLLQKRREARRIRTERNVGETAKGGDKPEKEKTSST